MTTLSPTLSPLEVEAEYGISRKTLANWRWARTGPQYVKTSPGKGGRVLYRRTAIDSWLDRHTVQTSPG